MKTPLQTSDPKVYELIESELQRRRKGLEMIPSENFVSPAVLEALGSIGTNKYSEGYPGRRYYGGCQYVDRIEQTAIDRAKKLFGVDHANVQPYSGSPANSAVEFALLEPGKDKIMGLSLAFGGHLTHGSPVSFSGKYFKVVPYFLDDKGLLDYDEIETQGSLYGYNEILPYGDMMQGYAAARGLKRYLIPLPVLTPRLSSWWVDLVTPIPAAYLHPLIEGLRNEVIVRDPGARFVFNIRLIPYAEAVRRATERTRLGEVETYWAGARAGLQPGVTLRVTEGMVFEERRVRSVAAPADVYAVFAGIGGVRGWFYADWLWQLRGLLDRLLGGVGMRRGRRNGGKRFCEIERGSRERLSLGHGNTPRESSQRYSHQGRSDGKPRRDSLRPRKSR